jgi:hyperosmotically inducible periplasmic protein
MKKFTLSAWILAPVLTCAAGMVMGQSSDTPSASMSRTAVSPDNSKSNKVDQSNKGPTADNQANNSSDMKITQDIRKSVMSDKSLSTYAHNAKIVTLNGEVTLNGVVNSQAESASIEQMATQVAGSGHVVNKLKVKSGK